MRIPAFLLVYTSLSGCAGGQLAELELEQQQLRAEYEDVAANVAALRDEMGELGLITRAQANAKAPSQGRSGKKIKPRGNPSPANDLSEGMPWTATRTGDKPTLPALADLERSSGDCGWRFHVRELQPISDFPLNRDGFGKASPVVMYAGDQPMSPHANPEDFEKACTGSYRHAGYLFLFSPTGNVDAASERSYRIELADEVPLPRDDGRPMYWVYPGTTLTFSVPGAWDPAWGEVRLDLR